MTTCHSKINKNITVGNATLVFDRCEKVWVLPGGRKLYSKESAKRMAFVLNQTIEDLLDEHQRH